MYLAPHQARSGIVLIVRSILDSRCNRCAPCHAPRRAPFQLPPPFQQPRAVAGDGPRPDAAPAAPPPMALHRRWLARPLARWRAFGRVVLGAMVAAILTACTDAPEPVVSELPDMGTFQLRHNIVIDKNAHVVPPSRRVSPAEWAQVLAGEVDRRFGSYKGGRNFHIALHVDAYALAVPGVPFLITPKSVLVVSATVWDDALGRKLNDTPERFVVFEGGTAAMIGSGLVRTRQMQMRALARNAARDVQGWMLEHPQWFAAPARGGAVSAE